MTWGNFIAFDTETTGLDAKARVVEIALVLFEGGEIKEQFSSYLNPGDIDFNDENVKKAMAVNKINPEDLKGQPTYEEIFHKLFIHFRSADVWVAHNTEFDMRMLHQENKRLKGADFPLRPRVSLDTKHLSNKLHPHEKGHKLVDVAPRWGVVQDGAHRAASDAITCGRILSAMVAKNAVPMEMADLDVFSKQASAAWGTGYSRRR